MQAVKAPRSKFVGSDRIQPASWLRSTLIRAIPDSINKFRRQASANPGKKGIYYFE